MFEKELIHTHEYYIKGYGFISDFNGNTSYGIPKELIYKFKDIETEFIENPDPKSRYLVDIPDVPVQYIPTGKLRIWGTRKNQYELL